MMLSLKLIFNNSFMTTERLNIKNGPFAAFWMAGTITEQLAKKTILSTQTNNLILIISPNSIAIKKVTITTINKITTYS